MGYGYHRHLPDVCLFARAQIARQGKSKIRATWGFPISVYLEEGRFFYPLQDRIKARDHDLPIAYGFETAHGGISQLNVMLERNTDAKFLCVDWKGFDKRIAPWLIREAFSIISEFYRFGQVRDADGCVWDVDPTNGRRW